MVGRDYLSRDAERDDVLYPSPQLNAPTGTVVARKAIFRFRVEQQFRPNRDSNPTPSNSTREGRRCVMASFADLVAGCSAILAHR